MTLSGWETNLPLLAGDLDKVFLSLTSLITNVMQNVMLARPGTQVQVQSPVGLPGATKASTCLSGESKVSYLVLSESWGYRYSPIPWRCQLCFLCCGFQTVAVSREVQFL